MNSGDIVTVTVSNAVGGEKSGSHPAVVIRNFGAIVLVAPMTDASKNRLPTHHFIPKYSSGTQVKDALVTCEHAIAVHPSRVAPRPEATRMSEAEVQGIRKALHIAVALSPAGREPPSQPRLLRGSFVKVDFSRNLGPEPSGVAWAVILSNDTGNYYGRHYLVAPLATTTQVVAVSLSSCPPARQPGAVDLGLLRVVDRQRIVSGTPTLSASEADLKAVDAALREMIR